MGNVNDASNTELNMLPAPQLLWNKGYWL